MSASRDVVYLVVRADRSVRVARKPRLAADEVALKVTLHFPDSWGRVFGEIDVQMPDATPTVDRVDIDTQSEDPS